MSNTLEKILVFDKNKNVEEINEAHIEDGKGIPGDRHYSDDKNQISVLFQNKDMAPSEGLCTKRFKANLTIDSDGKTEHGLHDEVCINDAVFELSFQKDCYDECRLHSKGLKCHLVDNALFMTVKKGGNIKIGDEVTIRPK